MVKRILISLSLVMLVCCSMTAVTLTDITSVYVTNPHFDGNSMDGWTREGYASGWNASYECMEVYQGTFDVYQVLTGLPKGKYRLSVQAFFRETDNNTAYGNHQNHTENLSAVLYAGDQETALASVYDATFDSNINYNCWRAPNGSFYPNGMASARGAFDSGTYNNTLEFETNGGDVRIGLKNSIWTSSNWCIFDNFKLEYVGTPVLVTQLSISMDSSELVIGETRQISAEVKPDNALLKTLAWTSGNQNVATVDQNGVVTGIAPGTAVITAKTTDGSNISKTLTVKVVSNMADASSVAINEIMAANIDEFVSPAFNFDGWMELYNKTNQTVQLSGLYLSDDAANLKKWRLPSSLGVLPAQGYQVVWFDSDDIAPQNAPFKLDVDGGTIFLSDEQGTIIAQQTYPAAMQRVSYARTTDGGETWGTTATPTPGASNAASRFASQQLDAPQVDQPSRLFDGTFTATVTIPAGATLRYTTDGSLPTLQHGNTSASGIFNISKTTNLRLRLFADGWLASPVTTRSYILRDRDGFYLPVVSVVADNDFLYSTELGVFEKGPNGRPGNGQSEKCNWNMNWERPVNFSYLSADGEMVLNQDVNLEICGGWSRAWDPRAFKLKGNKELSGNKNLLYPFFSEKPYIRNRTLQIRNGGNDNNCRFRDPALQMIAASAGLNLDYQEYQPVHEFINGKYIGMLNVREPNNKHYVYANYGWDDDEIDQFEMSPDSGYVQKCGTKDSFLELVDLSADAANPETYNEICRLLDVDEYANYMAIEFYLRNWDWPQNNVKAFRHRDNGKFRFVLFDLDGVFSINDPFNGFMGKERYTFDPLYPTSLGRITDNILFVTLFKNLVKNQQFRRKFIDSYCMMGGSVYEASRAVAIIDRLAAAVDPAMALENGSTYATANTLRNTLSSRLSSSLTDLYAYSPFALNSSMAQRVTLSSNTDGARIMVNDIEIPTGRFDGYLFSPATLRAVAPAGLQFLGWTKDAGASSTYLKPYASEWAYYDQGSLDGQNWQSPNYAESGWKKGQSPLGYNNPNVTANTVVDYTQRYVFYFRTNVQIDQTLASSDEVWLDYKADDGFVVYVNGTEAGRYNMPDGTPSYTTFANHYAHGNPDEGTLQLPIGLFHQGQNTIAVELHNESLRSSDILWEAALRLKSLSATTDFYSTNATIDLPMGDNLSLTAVYRTLTDSERQAQHLMPVRINEVSGSNSIHINEYGKKNDWVELYNITDEDIDIEGWYLTDNMDKPTKYQISKDGSNVSTVVPAHSHLLVWCDKLATTAQALHASFKVSGEGGYLMLTNKDRTLTDTLTYSAHDGNHTVGRYPDGSADVYTMNVPTIGRSNLLTSYMVKEDQKEITPTGVTPLIASSGDFRIRYGSQQLFVKGEDVEQAIVEIHATDGRLVERQSVLLSHGVARVSVAHLPAGFYIGSAISTDGTTVSCKFAKQ